MFCGWGGLRGDGLKNSTMPNLPDTDAPLLTTCDGRVYAFVFGLLIGPGFVDRDGVYRVDGALWQKM